MLKVKDGKLSSDHVLFEMPNGFYVKPYRFHGIESLLFVSQDKSIQITISIFGVQGMEKRSLKDIYSETPICEVKQKEFVMRGKETGEVIFYNIPEDIVCYEECYDYPSGDETQRFSVWIALDSSISKISLKEAMELPEIKSFLNSIEYF